MIFLRTLNQIMKSNQNLIYYKLQNQIRLLTTRDCLYQIYRQKPKINIERNFITGVTTISPSQQTTFKYSINKQVEHINHVTLKHSKNCPILNPMLTNPNKQMRLCSCVMIKVNDKFLITERSQNISFPLAWVMPGGRLEQGQSIIQGGIRQCVQQVNLDKNIITVDNNFKENEVMVWESLFVQNSKIKSGNIIFFFCVNSKNFEVKVQKEQVETYKWKSILEKEQDEKIYVNKQTGGYGEGHLNYISHYRQNNQ